MNDIRQNIIGYMAGRVPEALTSTLNDQTPLLTSGVLDSIGVLELMMHLETSFNIPIDDMDFDAENLETIGSLVRFVERKLAH